MNVALIAFSLNVWADCPDEHANLTDQLSKPLRKGNEIIAVVRGTLGTEGEIEHAVFERNLLTGVPKKYWLPITP